jgi:hypothetical protein
LGHCTALTKSSLALTFVEVLEVLVLVMTGVPVVALAVLAGLYDKNGLVILHDYVLVSFVILDSQWGRKR